MEESLSRFRMIRSC
ncbi:unnamed protein product [Linum tenue]|uniref:Uncharacterized protein n=1 Tax=Linum tenue TaxID=586396 RepID=A0AAV0MJD6_9ROSI|nr:unnamed protein product [Linum tenue]